MTDLAWLNDMDLANLLCQSPVPIFTGIGHERDNTILDEIAHTRFDTPSKVALHISTTIKDNAVAAIQAWERINALVGRIISSGTDDAGDPGRPNRDWCAVGHEAG